MQSNTGFDNFSDASLSMLGNVDHVESFQPICLIWDNYEKFNPK